MILLDKDELNAVSGGGGNIFDLIKTLTSVPTSTKNWEQYGKNYEVCMQEKAKAQPNGKPTALDNMDCFNKHIAPHIPSLPYNAKTGL